MSYVQLGIDQSLFTLTLTRIAQKNALSLEMYTELVDAFERFENDDSLKVLIIQGDAQCFCAGNDLKDFMAGGVLDESHPTVRFIRAIANCSKPVFAAVAGPAIGIGTTMLLHCDFVVAADNSRFQLPFAKLGLCPEAGSSLLLTHLAGGRIAFELLVMGQGFDAHQAERLGLVNRVCTPDDLLSLARDKALEVSRLPSDAVLASKALIRQSMQTEIDSTIALELAYFQRLLGSDECQSIMSQFFSKSQ